MNTVEAEEVVDMAGLTPQKDAGDVGNCHIRFLLVNGNDFRMEFPTSTPVKAVKNGIIRLRPQVLLELAEKTESPPPEKSDDIRILYLGKFLEDSKTLEECTFSVGEANSTTVHISLKPSTSATDAQRDRKLKRSGCCVLQ